MSLDLPENKFLISFFCINNVLCIEDVLSINDVLCIDNVHSCTIQLSMSCRKVPYSC